MKTRTATEWGEILRALGVKPATAALWAPIFADVLVPGSLSKGDEELDDFLGQVLHESAMLERLEENLNYKTPGRLMVVWPSRFKSRLDEDPYLNNPQALAEKVYGGRMGNTEPGYAFRYRGSGLIQLTGADNFRTVQEKTGIPVFDNPDLLRRPSREALRVCVAWWEGNIPDSIMGNIARVTRAVNGGSVGLDERRALTDKAHQELA